MELNPGPRKRLLCGSCKKHLGKSTKKRPLFWCTICGWVHFTCSGLSNATQYNAWSFVCLKCSQERVVSDALTNNPNFQKANKFYSDTTKSSAFGNSQTLAQHTGLPLKTVKQYLSTSATYTKFRQARRNFKRLTVLTYRLNEIWSLDLADKQSIASSNGGIRYLLVAVDTLSRYLRVEAMRNKNAITTKQAFLRMITKVIPERVWTDDGTEFLGEFATFCKKKQIVLYQTHNEKKIAFAERNIRSLKALIYRYMNEHHTDTYIDKLQNFVKIINNRTNRVTGLCPSSVTEDHVSYLVSLTLDSNIQKRPKFQIGDTVRIRRKIETFHKGYKVQFSHELFKVVAILTKNPTTYRLVSNGENEEEIKGRFYESELVKYLEI